MRLLLILLLTGCSSLSSIPEQNKNSIQDIPKVEKLTWERVEVPAKPAIQVQTIEDKRYATLDKQGMTDLIKLYSGAKDRTEEVNSLVQVLNKNIEERNRLLELAKAEELRSNALAKDLSNEREERIREQRSNSLQLTITRIVALVAMGFAL